MVVVGIAGGLVLGDGGGARIGLMLSAAIMVLAIAMAGFYVARRNRGIFADIGAIDALSRWTVAGVVMVAALAMAGYVAMAMLACIAAAIMVGVCYHARLRLDEARKPAERLGESGR